MALPDADRTASCGTTRLQRASGAEIGMVHVNRSLVDTIVTCEGERHESDPPWGIFGGHDGLNASMIRNAGTDREEHWPSKVTAARLDAGDTLQITVPNSAGTATRSSATRRPCSPTCSTDSPRSSSPSVTTVVVDPASLALDADATTRRREARTTVPA